MKTLIILTSFLALQRCNQTKNEQKPPGSNTSVEYREFIDQEKKLSVVGNMSGSIKNNDVEKDLTTEKNIVEHVKKDTILNNIQEKITDASYDGFAVKNTKMLDEIELFLEKNETDNKNLKNYWIAYINYYKTIIGMKLKNKELAEKSNKKGIETLVNIDTKNSDDYALLALLKGVSFSFVPEIEAPAISKDINKFIEKGKKADDTNFRIYYAEGSIDFYTPKEYGGGTKAEESLIKAINLPEKNIGNSQLPTWGKEEAYDLIIRLYLRDKQKDKAKSYFDKAKQLFPNSYIVQMYQSNFQS